MMGDSLGDMHALPWTQKEESLDDSDLYNIVLVMCTLSLKPRKNSLNDGGR